MRDMQGANGHFGWLFLPQLKYNLFAKLLGSWTKCDSV